MKLKLNGNEHEAELLEGTDIQVAFTNGESMDEVMGLLGTTTDIEVMEDGRTFEGCTLSGIALFFAGPGDLWEGKRITANLRRG